MMRSLYYTLTVAASLILVSLVCAGDGPLEKHGHGRFLKCPNCHNTCTLSVEKGKVTRECYDVECKQICIPRVTFPWQKKACCGGCGGKGCGDCKEGCCAARTCAKAKTVRVLKKYEYECSHCKYQWTPVDYKDKVKDDVLKDGEIAPIPEGDVTVPPPPPVSAQHRPAGQPVVRVATR